MAAIGLLTHLKGRDINGAEEILRRALLIEPGNADVLCNLAGVYMDDGRKEYDLAEEHFKLALASDPGHVASLSYYGLLVQEVGP